MSDRTPSLDQIRGRYCDGTTVQTGRLTGGEEFDRAIAKVRAEAKAEALREAADEFPGHIPGRMSTGYWLRTRADKLVTE